MNTPRQPPRQVPTLTEVVDVNAQRGEEAPEQPPDAPVAPVPAPPPVVPRPPLVPRRPLVSTPVQAMVSEEQLTQRVLLDLQKHIEQLLEQRLRETVEPALVRLADAMVNDARDQLAMVLRDMVAHAVTQELARHKSLGPLA
ncbi:MAG TPA: hypothetical protein VFL86_02230 [Burkholderiaceae bacterium]|nr:hypothetical protein [Burkholderiaceae bacterium]